MELLGSYYNIDLALLPIGGNFTMDPADALRAIDLIKPKAVIPMHYDTFPLIKQEPAFFAAECAKKASPAMSSAAAMPSKFNQLLPYS